MATSGEAGLERLRQRIFRGLWRETSFRSKQLLYDNDIIKFAIEDVVAMIRQVRTTPTTDIDINVYAALYKQLVENEVFKVTFLQDWKALLLKSCDIVMEILGPNPGFPSMSDSDQIHEQFFLLLATKLNRRWIEEQGANERDYGNAYYWLLELRTHVGGLKRLHNEMAIESNRRNEVPGMDRMFKLMGLRTRRSDSVHIF